MAFKGKFGAIKVNKQTFEFSGAETLFWNCRWPFELFVRQTKKFKNFVDRFMFNKSIYGVLWLVSFFYGGQPGL